jgi:hypothetical protein
LTRLQRRKIKSTDLKLLGSAIERVKIIAGIEIKGDKEIIELQKHLIWLKDKYNENFNKKVKPVDPNAKKITILDYVGSFVLYSGGSFTGLGKMTIPEFVTLKNNANVKYEAEKKQLEEINHARN